ncbi:MAG: tetratricopeptide repeat protein [Candidatus Saccharibacteria bacterium]|nr:tetratricopeptide repeat protein [Rhodoferax sp.]
MKHVSSYVIQSLRAITLAATFAASMAYADEYSDVSQLVRSGKLADALTKADQYLVAKPRDPQMRFLKGVIQRDSGKTADAIATFARLTEDYPELPEPYNNLAVLYAGQSQFDKARTALEMAIRTNPSYATAHENLGDVYAKLASLAYSKALQLDNENQAVAPKLALIRELFSPQAVKPAKPSSAGTPVATKLPAVSPAVSPAVAPATGATAASVASTAAPSAAISKPAEGTGPASQEVESAVKAWAAAWAAKDVKSYLALYSKEFNPPGNLNRSAWEQERKLKISSKSRIEVKIDGLSVDVAGEKATAKFRQDYKAGALAVSSRKTLELVKRADRWQIVRETVGG